MHYVDLHCDTLTELLVHNTDLVNEQLHISLDRLPADGGYLQTMAIFMPDEYRGEPAAEYFDRHYACYREQLEKYAHRMEEVVDFSRVEDIWDRGKTGCILSIEGGSALCGQIRRVRWMAERRVRMITLTWNGANELGGGQMEDIGLTDFGRQAVAEMEKWGIVVDVSHLGDRGFAEICRIAKRPFVATHSNSRTIWPHKRNLTDAQFLEFVRRGGLVGLNFYIDFLGDGAQESPQKLLEHIKHFLALGGEDVLALGSDFDGSTVPDYLNSADRLTDLTQYLLEHGLEERVVEKIMYRNALNFWQRYEAEKGRS